jgi:hypothetical protein
MAFLNSSIITTSCSGTSVTGSTIYSGSSEWSTIRISQNRKLLYSSRNNNVLLSGTGVIAETIFASVAIPPNTLRTNDTLEIYAQFHITVSGVTTNPARIRIGPSADTTGSQIVSVQSMVANNASGLLYSRSTYNSNTTFQSIQMNSNPYSLTLSFVSASTLNLSAGTTYIHFTGQRGNLGTTFNLRNYDIFLNRL